MIEFGDLVIGNINYVSVIRYEFGCICGVINNLFFLGFILYMMCYEIVIKFFFYIKI